MTEGTIFVEKEKLVDGIETQLKMDFTEEQRAAVLSRVYNGVPKDDTITALRKDGTPEATLAFFASNRGGPDHANPGHYARTIEEAREFLGDSVKAATVGNAKGFTYTDKDGSEVFIGSQSEKVGGKTHAELVAYKVVNNEDQSQTQVPVAVSGLPKYMNVAASGHLPLDPSVEFNNAYLTGDPAKMLNALSLDPTIKTPHAALDELHKYVPELGEEQDINLGTDAKPQWVKGYVTTDDEGHTTVLAVGKDAKGKPALVGYEIDAPTEANPNPEPHAIPVTAPQSKLPALKTSDAGDIDGTVQIADDGNPESQVQSDTLSDFHTALLDAFTNPTLPNIVGPATQYAALNTPNTASDAGPGLPESAISSSPTQEPNPNIHTEYLQSQGAAVTPTSPAYLAPTLQDQGYTGATGTTPYKPATTQQVNALQDLYNNSPTANAQQVVSATATVININFDGTKNNGQFPASGEASTNVFELTRLQREVSNPNNTIYLPGVGAQTVPTGTLDGKFGGGKSAPPPPVGSAHFSWDADGQIQHTIDHNQSGGGVAADQAAASVQALLEQVVQMVNEANAQKTGDHSHDVAINPYLLPRIHFSGNHAWMEVTQADGSTTHEGIGQEGFAERLISILQDNGGLAPAWQVATVQGHWAQAQEELADLRAQLSEAQKTESPQAAQIQQQIDARQQALDHELHAGKGGHAYAGNEAYSLQGNAAESADFKTQDFGVLVVHISQHVAQNPGVQASAQALDQTLENIQKQALQLSETLRDMDIANATTAANAHLALVAYTKDEANNSSWRLVA